MTLQSRYYSYHSTEEEAEAGSSGEGTWPRSRQGKIQPGVPARSLVLEPGHLDTLLTAAGEGPGGHTPTHTRALMQTCTYTHSSLLFPSSPAQPLRSLPSPTPARGTFSVLQGHSASPCPGWVTAPRSRCPLPFSSGSPYHASLPLHRQLSHLYLFNVCLLVEL